MILGLGAGNIERDFEAYGYRFASGRDRLRTLEEAIGRIKRRLDLLDPPPLGPLPLLVGGSGQRVTLRLVAQHADGHPFDLGPVHDLIEAARRL